MRIQEASSLSHQFSSLSLTSVYRGLKCKTVDLAQPADAWFDTDWCSVVYTGLGRFNSLKPQTADLTEKNCQCDNNNNKKLCQTLF